MNGTSLLCLRGGKTEPTVSPLRSGVARCSSLTYPIASVSNITQLNATTNPVWAKRCVGMPTAMVPTLVNARLSIYG